MELSTQLKKLGFNDSGLINSLRDHIMKGEDPIFTINYREKINEDELRTWFDYEVGYEKNSFELKRFNSMLSFADDAVDRSFKPDITRNETLAVLYYEREQDRYNMWNECLVTRAELNRLPLPAIIEHGHYHGINTHELDNQMSNVDWHRHPGNWFYDRDNPADLQLKEMRRLEKQLDKLGVIDGPPQAVQVWEHLLVKHFSGTSIGDALCEGAPYLAASFADRRSEIIIVHLNNKVMNTQNAEFLKKSLLNLGFGESLNAELDKKMEAKTPEFMLALRHEFNQKNVDYVLHFKAGDNKEMYFFNRYDATIPHKDDPAKNINQTFYINKGSGITAKEAFNLMEGRAVHKTLTNLESKKYQAWITLDDQNLTENGNKKLKHFHENYGYDIEKVLAGKGIKELESNEAKNDLLRSLKKGNAQQITVASESGNTKYFVAANPQYKTVDLFDEHMKKIKREVLLEPGAKKNEKLNNKASVAEDAAGKKQSKKSKVHV